MQKRRRFKQTTSLRDRLSVFVAEARVEVDCGAAKADPFELLRKVRQAETAANIQRWVNSPELRPPK